MSFELLAANNPEIKVYKAKDASFRPYGRLINVFNLNDIVHFAQQKIKIPYNGVEYYPSVAEFEKLEVIKDIRDFIYGQMPIEVGTCAGQNTQLLGMEYHQGSETIIAITDCLLILGKLQDMENCTYDTKSVEYFYIDAGECVELYSTTLHYAPCQITKNGFAIICILPQGTNFESTASINPLLTMKNKFFITHPSQTKVIMSGAVPGLRGAIPKIKLT